MNKKRTVKEVVAYLQTIDDENDDDFKKLLKDDRKGVQEAIKSWRRKRNNQKSLIQKYKEMTVFEEEAQNKGFTIIAGVDEVGRGPLAGPVVAACVVLDPRKPILGLDDSKKLSAKKRLSLYQEIKEKALVYGVGQVSPEEIDNYNILQASKLAMVKAIENANEFLAEMNESPIQFALVDAINLDHRVEQMSIIKGDQKSISIAAASIIAKEIRDKYMLEIHLKYPAYGFNKNVGYGTAQHIQALKEHGPCIHHRQSFEPVKKYQK